MGPGASWASISLGLNGKKQLFDLRCTKGKKLKLWQITPGKEKGTSSSHTGSRTRAAWVKTRNPNR